MVTKVSTFGLFEPERQELMQDIIKKFPHIIAEKLDKALLSNVITAMLHTAQLKHNFYFFKDSNLDHMMIYEIFSTALKVVAPTIERIFKLNQASLSSIGEEFARKVLNKSGNSINLFKAMKTIYSDTLSYVNPSAEMIKILENDVAILTLERCEFYISNSHLPKKEIDHQTQPYAQTIFSLKEHCKYIKELFEYTPKPVIGKFTQYLNVRASSDSNIARSPTAL